MSKISGVFSPYFDRQQIKFMNHSMISRMVHLAKQRVGEFVSDKAGLGHLSIGAVNTEEQPITFMDRSIIMAGKIFGYEKEKMRLIRKGYTFRYENNDAEFILYLYQEYGAAKFRDLNGIFAFCIWDAKKEEMVLVNDRHGIRPIYWHFDKKNNIFAFASELKSISILPNLDKKINWEAWNVFLRLGFFIDNDTFYKDVFFLPQASILRYDMKEVKIENYWDSTQIIAKKTFNEPEDTEQLVSLFKQSMNRRIIPGRKVAVFLSGGLDSSGISAELKRRNVDFITYTTRKFNRYDEDRRPAAFVAKMLEIENRFCDLPENFLDFYEPLKNDLLDYQCKEHAWLLPLMETLPPDTKINFDGLGFDFMCDTCMHDEAHVKFRNMLEHKQYDDFIKAWYYSPTGYHYLFWPATDGKSDFPFLSKKLRDKFSYEAFAEKIKVQLRKVENTDAPYVFFHLITRARRCVGTSVFGMIVNWVESFCPYLDNDFFECLMTLPLSARLNRTLRTKILRQGYPYLFTPNSCLVGSNINKFINQHNEFYTLRVRYLSKITAKLMLNLRSEIFDPVYLMPRLAKDAFMSRMYLMAKKDDHRDLFYRKLHMGLMPPISMLNDWLIHEKIREINYD